MAVLGYQPDPTTIVTDFEQTCITAVSTTLGLFLPPDSKYLELGLMSTLTSRWNPMGTPPPPPQEATTATCQVLAVNSIQYMQSGP